MSIHLRYPGADVDKVYAALRAILEDEGLPVLHEGVAVWIIEVIVGLEGPGRDFVTVLDDLFDGPELAIRLTAHLETAAVALGMEFNPDEGGRFTEAIWVVDGGIPIASSMIALTQEVSDALRDTFGWKIRARRFMPDKLLRETGIHREFAWRRPFPERKVVPEQRMAEFKLDFVYVGAGEPRTPEIKKRLASERRRFRIGSDQAAT